jgi:hypothetical protein
MKKTYSPTLSQILFCGLIFLHAAPSFAGWGSSGGGEIYDDLTNPWFLKNVSEVRYCISVGSSFSVPKDQAKQTVKASIDYWKAEFARSNQPMNSGSSTNTLGLGTQNFLEVECLAGNIDLEFDLGYEALSTQQKTFLVDARKYIGIAIRTDYDTLQMRGKGFIYISSDFGVNMYQNPTGALIKQNAWQQKNLLQYALLHEIGHTFGLPHAGGGLMAQTFLEQILNQKIAGIFSSQEIESYLSPNSSLESCDNLDLAAKQFFGVASNTRCIRLEIAPNGGYSIKSTVDQKSYSVVGSLKAVMPNVYDLRSKPVVVLNLTEDQKVFTQAQAGYRNFINGPATVDLGANTSFIPVSGAPKSLYARISPTSFALFGSAGTITKPVFLYNSTLSAALMISNLGSPQP